ncbi:hypothetical protein [Longirhabdus pacifica]|uniref:hypothetical protein n=1 Tax=Longirhabdus pacifica TaxID=2305227 RepID=UPI001008BF81|nr:hypothetical protein [Longirhabdus pacifica]
MIVKCIKGATASFIWMLIVITVYNFLSYADVFTVLEIVDSTLFVAPIIFVLTYVGCFLAEVICTMMMRIYSINKLFLFNLLGIMYSTALYVYFVGYLDVLTLLVYLLAGFTSTTVYYLNSN